MTETTTKKKHPPLRAGDTVHWVNNGPAVGTKRNDIHGAFIHLGERGSVMVITDEILEVNQDREGSSLFDIIDDDDEQIRRWGEVKIRRGPKPDGLTDYVPGTVDHELAYQEAHYRIEATTSDPDERAARLSVLNQSELGRGRPRFENTTKYLRDE
ncbi:hypothetical protein [Microbacterium aurugineum]|uniref:Hypervirulence associated protein TUDOR domain-containing protein n=1 Tax=Microbacterium aurugineum TaxID=2851642 RepID=A0ABY4IWV8_9MICO|nr:hypothetical protein [Microbacterium aurugineum]UPL17250.1 hypothetical protein KV397_05505 [Microbacterium aurugineum]